MKRKIFAIIMLAMATLQVFAANKKQTVTQVTTDMSLTDNVDLHVTSPTPFSANGSIDIVNTDHAVVIFEQVRPSQLSTTTLRNHLKINGQAARLDVNCQIRIYNQGCMILPYTDQSAPLTLFTASGQKGESCSNYNLQSNNGFMNTLTDEQLNNRALSFRLKRGYMVTFSTLPNGRGYSRCFIASDKDIEMNFPNILQGRVSSYRLFKWNDVNKSGWGGSQTDINAALNTTWCYDWGAGNPSFTDREYVTHHHNKWWPGFDEVGRNGSSPHALGNNEPDNTNDPNEIATSVAEVLSTWEEMMATGKRLGSPAVAGNTAWLSEFMDSIDARGWRCDFVAVHAYWYSSRWDWEWLLNEYHNNYGNGRPIWITEMNWGAGWTGWPNGNRDANAQNYQTELDGFRPILEFLSSCSYIERYAPFNLWEGCYKFHNGDDQSLAGKSYLTPIGEYYAGMNPGLAYNSSNEYIPALPQMYAPNDVRLRGRNATGVVTISWYDRNGEYNKVMEVERQNTDVSDQWESVASIKPKETASSYSYNDTVSVGGTYSYRIRVVPCTRGRNVYSEVKTWTYKPTSVDAVAGEEASVQRRYSLNGTRMPTEETGRKGIYVVDDGVKRRKVVVK